MTITYTYEQIPSVFGVIGLVWFLGRGGADPVVRCILLPIEGVETKALIMAQFPGAADRSADGISPVNRQIRRYLEGKKVEFSLKVLDLGVCRPFQQKVLRLDFQIPPGKAMTYGGLADRLGHPRAARAVGTALARNPFPLVIPCHRVIRADGMLGGFGGGLKMKRALLEMEGVVFDRKNRIQESHLWP
jgi:methylated-DNA-[protein]-cysteine S-methyltransferase